VDKPVDIKIMAERICPLALFRGGFGPRVAGHGALEAATKRIHYAMNR